LKVSLPELTFVLATVGLVIPREGVESRRQGSVDGAPLEVRVIPREGVESLSYICTREAEKLIYVIPREGVES